MADGPLDEEGLLGPRITAPAPIAPEPARRNIWPWAISGLLFAFALGLVGSPWMEREARSLLPPALQAEAVMAQDPRVDQLTDRLSRLEAAAGQSASSSGQVPVATDTGPLTARIDMLQLQLDALASDLARANSAQTRDDERLRDLFLLAVTRRMMEAGRPLTSIEAPLAQRFRSVDGAAVEAFSAWSMAPQTMATLSQRLAATRLDPPTSQQSGWWDKLKTRLQGLVTVRKAEDGAVPAVSADDEALLRSAVRAMEESDLQRAMALVGQMQPTPALRQWAADALLLANAKDALERLETGALEKALAQVQAEQTLPTDVPGAVPLPAGPAPQSNTAPGAG